ncbi:MAG: MFS transporter [Thermoleophilia bacterium]
MRQGPLAGRYPAVAAMVMAALIPFLALSAAVGPVTPIIARDLHTSMQAMAIGVGLANAAYAVGTVLAVQFSQLLPQRRVLLVYAFVLVVGSVLTTTARDVVMYSVGQILAGLCTSLMLIAAVPPLSLGFPASKLRITGMIMNMCIFGAVALGPTIGGLQAEADAWRPLFWTVSGIALLALVLALLTFEDAPPADPSAPVDTPALLLATVGCVAAFFGSSQLLTHRFLSPVSIIPLVAGLLTIIGLVVYQYRARNPLLTIRELLGSSIPIAGIIVALFAAAASVSATALTASALAEDYGPLHLGLLYLPEAGGAVITAIALGVVLDTRFLHHLPLVGMGFLAAGIAVFLIRVPSTQPLALVASFLTGIGLGATVAPALFVAGFSLRALNLQRVFAIVELFRAVAAFMIAPIFAHLAASVGDTLADGVRIALWIGLGLALVGAVLAVATYAFSGARPQTPDIDGFVSGRTAAWSSPPLLAKLRRTAVPAEVATEGVD